jgi:histidine ammonia-lyase
MELDAKEGLGLINGTQAMTALGALMVHDAEQLCAVADVAGAMTLEAVKGTLAAFDPRVAVVRPHPGAAASAANVRRVGAGSAIHASHADCGKVQDAYSLRCIPQVHGATRDALAHARAVLEREANSVTDNPLLFPDTEDVLSAGNFHGQPVALVLDYAKLAVCELANISERRTAHLMDPGVSGLPAFLAPSGGLHSGLMIVQYTAASLVSENKVLAHPASADSIPTSANQEDHVSMGHDERAPRAAGARERRVGGGHRAAVRGAGARLPPPARSRRRAPARRTRRSAPWCRGSRPTG